MSQNDGIFLIARIATWILATLFCWIWLIALSSRSQERHAEKFNRLRGIEHAREESPLSGVMKAIRVPVYIAVFVMGMLLVGNAAPHGWRQGHHLYNVLASIIGMGLWGICLAATSGTSRLFQDKHCGQIETLGLLGQVIAMGAVWAYASTLREEALFDVFVIVLSTASVLAVTLVFVMVCVATRLLIQPRRPSKEPQT
jgi:putative effector of murein hydrolase LrgA (UPF0299 family)